MRLSAFIDRDHPDESLLFRKPTNRIAHTGGERIHPGSDEEKTLREWIAYLASFRKIAARRRALPGGPTPVVRRLTQSQYNHTVADLLGDQTRPADQFPQEDYINGFTNQAEGQSIPPVLAEAYNRAAEKLARNAFRGGDRNHLIPCVAVLRPTLTACRRFIREFGGRPSAVPCSTGEVARYEKLFAAEAPPPARLFSGRPSWWSKPCCNRPVFCSTWRKDPDGAIRAYRAASRLSYFLWDTMPIKLFRRAAAAGELRPRNRSKSSRARMLDDLRAKHSMDVFLGNGCASIA